MRFKQTQVEKNIPLPPTFGNSSDYEQALDVSIKASKQTKIKVNAVQAIRQSAWLDSRQIMHGIAAATLIASTAFGYQIKVLIDAEKTGISYTIKSRAYQKRIAAFNRFAFPTIAPELWIKKSNPQFHYSLASSKPKLP